MFREYLLLFGSSTIIVTVLHFLRVPSIIAFFLVGLLIGPHGLNLIPDISKGNMIEEVGIILLMFTIGLEFSIRHIMRLRKAFFGLGLLQSLATISIFFLVFFFLYHQEWRQAVTYGLLGFISSTALILKLLKENYDSSANSPYGNTTVGVLVFQDIVSIFVIILIPYMGIGIKTGHAFTWQAFARTTAGIVVIAISIYFTATLLLPYLIKKVSETRSKEIFLFCMAALCFGMASAAHFVGLSFGLGAFVMGVMIASSPFNKQAISELIPLRDTFLSILFIALGMQLDPKFAFNHMHYVLLLFVTVITVKFLVTYSSATILGYPQSVSLLVSLTLFQIGEFSFVIADQARSFELIPDQHFQYFIAVGLLTMMATPLVFRKAPQLLAFQTARKRKVEQAKPEEHRKIDDKVLLIGFGFTGRKLSESFDQLSIPYTVVDLNYKTIEELTRKGAPAIYGDASQNEILESAGAHSARLIVIAVAGRIMTQNILNALQHIGAQGQIIARLQYVQEQAELQVQAKVETVVAENEAAEMVLLKSLELYGIEQRDIETVTRH